MSKPWKLVQERDPVLGVSWRLYLPTGEEVPYVREFSPGLMQSTRVELLIPDIQIEFLPDHGPEAAK